MERLTSQLAVGISGEPVSSVTVEDMRQAYLELVERGVLPSPEDVQNLMVFYREFPYDPIAEHRRCADQAGPGIPDVLERKG